MSCTPSFVNGLIYMSTARFTVGLIVVNGMVIDAAPYARKWTLGRQAAQVWRDARRRGARVVWLPR
jgi:hypothetical protein